MSQWTHVAGMVRIDTLDGIVVRRDTIDTLRRIIIASNLPTGSEGSLHPAGLQTREHTSFSWGHIAIWGDLRDYGDARQVEELCEWFGRLTQALLDEHYIIRQAILQVEVERVGSFTLSSRLAVEGNKSVVRIISVPVPEKMRKE